jgi:hypothetical protein
MAEQIKLKKQSTFFHLNWKLQEYEFALVSKYVVYQKLDAFFCFI